MAQDRLALRPIGALTSAPYLPVKTSETDPAKSMGGERPRRILSGFAPGVLTGVGAACPVLHSSRYAAGVQNQAALEYVHGLAVAGNRDHFDRGEATGPLGIERPQEQTTA